MPGPSANRVELAARVSQVEPLRYTPAGVPILNLQLDHASEAHEAGVSRKVSLSLPAVVIGPQAQALADQAIAGQALQVSGFLASRRHGRGEVVLHIQQTIG